ncbi:hypothetical protein BGZ65_010368 [Modicella reniformis]|uniref:AMP-dependent synthetase/ligase domain-containing protein n=1 Tax=Modicella reniformis TaxID=1440133 RepID=A0A9P6MC14_9FUNG|nr:hypothetical protein BGZ65_010368 [Modicella reniformis]
MYKTGDIGRYLPDGNIVFLGRNDHQVKIRGFRIELGEIEAQLASHPLVKSAVVIAMGDDCDKQLVAFAVAEPVGFSSARPWGFKITLNTLFGAPTLAKLVQHLLNTDNTQDFAFEMMMLPIKPKGSKAPLFCIHLSAGVSSVFRGTCLWSNLSLLYNSMDSLTTNSPHLRQVIPEEEGTLETHAGESDEADDDNNHDSDDNDDNNHDSDDNCGNYDDNPTEDYAAAEDYAELYQTPRALPPNTKLPRAILPNTKLPRLTIRAKRILLEGRQMRMPAKTYKAHLAKPRQLIL